MIEDIGTPSGPDAIGGKGGQGRMGLLLRGASTFAVKILAYGSGAIVSILVARALGPHERGVWSLALSLASLFALAADAGLSTSSLYLMRLRPDRIRAVAIMGAGLAVFGSAVVSAAVLSLRRLGSQWLSGMPADVLLIVGVLIPLFALIGLFRQLLTALDDIPGANGSLITQSVLVPLVLLATVMLAPAAAKWALIGYLGALAVTTLATAARLRSRLPRGARWDSSLAGPLLRFGLMSQLASVALLLTYRSDLFLVGHWLGLSAAGVYSVGLTLSEILRGVPETAQVLVVSRALRDDLTSQAAAMARTTVLLTAAAGAALAVLAPIVVPLAFGRDFSRAAIVFACLVPGIVGLAVSYAISPLLFLEGRVGVSALGGFAAVIVLWAFSVLAPGPVGLAKVAIASSLAYWTLATVQLAYLAYRGRIEPRALVPRSADVLELFRAASRIRTSG
jgi:O-antigen/teichoic acid export membrane protein